MAGRGAVRSTGAARISGSVWNAADQGIGGALVRLRNTVTGAIEASVQADAAGQFVFQGIEVGSYVVEVVTANGTIQALGQSFAVSAGESVAT